MIRFIHWHLPVLILAILTGCASSTTTTGTKLAELVQPVDRMTVIVEYGKIGPARNNVDMAKDGLFAELPNRLPLVFAEHGVTAKVIILKSESGLVDPFQLREIGSEPFLMHISPKVIRHHPSSGAIGIDFGAMLHDQSSKTVVWRGILSFGKAGSAKVNEASADEFSTQLFAQLQRDGIVRVTSNFKPPAKN
jgi:hypothetical protein